MEPGDRDSIDVASTLRQRMVFTIVDVNNHAVEVTYILPDGKAIEARGDFQRTK